MPPAINTTGDVVLSITYNDGTTDTSKTVTIPNCILFDVDAPSGDATGEPTTCPCLLSLNCVDVRAAINIGSHC